jgi:hypothetical protein
MTLDSVEGVDGMVFDLDQRTVTVTYDTDGAAVESALEALDLKMTPLSDVAETSETTRPDEADRRCSHLPHRRQRS